MERKITGKLPKSSQDILGKFLSRWRNRVVAKQVSLPFLDIACGDNILVRKVGNGIGIDIQNYGDVDLLVEHFDELPFKDESFQSVTIVASLNYVEHPDRVLSECVRVLRPDGGLILTLLNPSVGKLWHSVREPWARHPGFSSSQLEQMAGTAGLQIASRGKFMLGMNNLYKLKKATRPIFLVSTGRTGTKYFSRFFSAYGSGVTSYHTPRFSRLLNVLGNMYYLGFLPRNIMKVTWKFVRYKWILSHTTRYIECNPHDYNLIDIISDFSPEARFIFVIRSPRSYVVSHINWERQRWKSIIANRLVPFWQPMPYLEEIKGFTNDYYQRVDFYSRIWERKNAHIMRSIAKNDNAITLMFEDVFHPQKGVDVLTGLMEWLDVSLVRPIDSDSVTARRNVSKGDGKNLWDEQCAKIISTNAGGLMKEFGYKE